jgi:hypothetical protein
LLFIILFISCEEKPPISEDKLIKIYSKLISVPDSVATDSSNYFKFRKKVFSDFGVNENDYEQSVNYYKRNPDRLEDFFNKVTKNIESTKDSTKTSL